MNASLSPRYRVLVVDDVEVNRLIAADLLHRLGIATVEATNGSEALHTAQVEPFDLILMDIQMPVMDGFAATAAIRDLRSPVADIPIIAITAGGAFADAARCAAAGMNGFLHKPIKIGSFNAMVLKWLPARADEA